MGEVGVCALFVGNYGVEKSEMAALSVMVVFCVGCEQGAYPKIEGTIMQGEED